jgi:hypothetical protein
MTWLDRTRHAPKNGKSKFSFKRLSTTLKSHLRRGSVCWAVRVRRRQAPKRGQGDNGRPGGVCRGLHIHKIWVGGTGGWGGSDRPGGLCGLFGGGGSNRGRSCTSGGDARLNVQGAEEGGEERVGVRLAPQNVIAEGDVGEGERVGAALEPDEEKLAGDVGGGLEGGKQEER